MPCRPAMSHQRVFPERTAALKPSELCTVQPRQYSDSQHYSTRRVVFL